MNEGVAALGHPQESLARDVGDLFESRGEDERRQRHAAGVRSLAGDEFRDRLDAIGVGDESRQRSQVVRQCRDQVAEVLDPASGLTEGNDRVSVGCVGLLDSLGGRGDIGGRHGGNVELRVGQ